MYFAKRLLILFLMMPIALAFGGVSAGDKREHEHGTEQEKRQHEAHFHGIGQLNPRFILSALPRYVYVR